MFRQEYLCEFVEREGAVFSQESIERLCRILSRSICRKASQKSKVKSQKCFGAGFGGCLYGIADYFGVACLFSGARFGAETESFGVGAGGTRRGPWGTGSELDRVTFERRRALRFRIPFLQRVRLGTPYPDVVDRVREFLRRPALPGRCTLVMDATGVGQPVLDMLRKANLGCSIAPVIMTGGERESHAGGLWHVPKRDLITGLQVMLEKRELGLLR